MPTEAKLGVVLGLGLLIFSAVTVAKPGTTIGSGPVRPDSASSFPTTQYQEPQTRLTVR